MPKPKDTPAVKSTSTEKRQKSNPAAVAAASSTSPSTPVLESFSTRREDVEKTYFKLCRTGNSLIGLVCNENANLQKELETIRKAQTPELLNLVKEIRAFQATTHPEASNFAQKFDSIQNQMEKNHVALYQHFMARTEWKTDITGKIERLMNLKTPCALTKVDMINAMRKEYDSFRVGQKFLEEQRPSPLTLKDLQPFFSDFLELQKRIDRLEEMFISSKNDYEATLETILKKLDAIHNDVNADDLSSSSLSSLGSRQSARAVQRARSPVKEATSATTIPVSSQVPQKAPSPVQDAQPPGTKTLCRRLASPPQCARSHQRRSSSRRSRSRHGTSMSRSPRPPTWVPSTVQIPTEDHPLFTQRTPPRHRERSSASLRGSSREIRDQLRDNEQKLRDANKAMEDALRANTEASRERHGEIARDKRDLLRRRDRLEQQHEDLLRNTHLRIRGSEDNRTSHSWDHRSEGRCSRAWGV